ncbi:hypothetical protein HPB49_026472 [Dermacentor silvarum]|nr:hypothetical protein HPB49_026472 [Dermacentor silvarum]
MRTHKSLALKEMLNILAVTNHKPKRKRIGITSELPLPPVSLALATRRVGGHVISRRCKAGGQPLCLDARHPGGSGYAVRSVATPRLAILSVASAIATSKPTSAPLLSFVLYASVANRHCSRAAMSSRGKYRAKTLKEKLEILRAVDAGKQSKNEIAKKHDISRSTLSTYIRNKKTIEDSYAAETFSKHRKRLHTAKHLDLEAALLTCIKEKRSQDTPLSGPIIVAKAADFAQRLNMEHRMLGGIENKSH